MTVSAGPRAGVVNGLYYQCYGAGAPVIALHGLGATMYSWRHLVEPLSQRRLVYLLDLKGHGKSEKPQDDKYTLSDQVKLVVGFIDELDLRNLTIIGHSMGGAISLLATIKLLKETVARLSSLVLLDPVALPQQVPFLFKALQLPVLPSLALWALPPKFWSRMVLRLAYYDWSKITHDAVMEYAKNLATPAGRHALLAVVRQMVPANIDAIIEQYQQINVPTQLIWGRNDRIMSPASAILLNGLIENSVLSMIDQCGHIPHEEQPSRVIPMITEFVERTSTM